MKRGRIIPGQRLLRNARQAFRETATGERDIISIPSYMGHFKHMNSYNVIKELFDTVGWEYLEDDAFRTKSQSTKKNRPIDDFSWLIPE